MKKWLVTAAIFAFALSAGAASASAEKIKACWIYVGSIGDFGGLIHNMTPRHKRYRRGVDGSIGRDPPSGA